MIETKKTYRNPWAWVPSLYLAEGIPYTIAMFVSVIMYKKMGISNTDIALYTSWLYLPWVIKPLWSPVVDILRTKRFWIVTMQFIIGVLLASVALTIPLPSFFQITLAILWLMAFSGATHDIAADGYYMLALDQGTQAEFVGMRSLFYRIAMISGQGLLVILAGYLENHGGIAFAWSVSFMAIAAIFMILSIYHKFILPYPVVDVSKAYDKEKGFLGEFLKTFVIFFKRKEIGLILAFLLLYRLNESQLIKLITPFLLDAREKGGIGLTTSDVGFAYGVVGIIGLLLGGITGGFMISKRGLKFWLLPMVLTIHIPDLMYVLLSQFRPDNLAIVSAAVGLEQFTYGFSFTAYTMFMIMVSEGEHKTAHYAICTGLMALGMMLPGMISGKLQEWLGYQTFFLTVLVSVIPAFVVAMNVKVDPKFGKKILISENS
jgi:PAT family beta-lactamase induction signal transducer AmpG